METVALYSSTIIIGLGIISIILIIALSVAFSKISSLNKRITELTDSTDARNIEVLIKEYYADINALKSQNNELSKLIGANSEWLTKTFCKSDVIRYNPLDDMGGELSFVLTMLDANNNGFVLNSIYSHNFSQVYIKPVENGFSDIKLSYDEMESLKRAVNKKV